MQTSAISTSYLLRSLQGAAGVGPPDKAGGTGQNSPTGEIAPPGGCASSLKGASFGSGQFAGSTLASLLSTQDETSPAADMASQLIGQLDTDADGVLSKDEVSAAVKSGTDISAGFAKLDTSGDGSLSADELQTALQSRMDAGRPHGGRPPPPSAGSAGDDASAIISSLDTNGDGTLSLQEITAALASDTTTTTGGAATSTAGDAKSTASTKMADGFAGLDGDSDGQLNLDELTNALAQAFGARQRYDWAYADPAAASSAASTTTAVA